MDFLPAHGATPIISRAFSWRSLLFAALALGAYAVLLAPHFGTHAAGADSSGYMNHARLLAAGQLHVAPRAVPGIAPYGNDARLCVPLGFIPAPNGADLVPMYPVGLPLLIVAAVPIAGWEHASDVVIGLHALLGILLTYALARTMGLSPRGGLVAAVVIAASPLYANYSLQVMSDLPALVWTLGAVLAAWRSRDRPSWALAAGAAASVAVLIRPSNALIFLPLSVALGLSPRRWLLLILGGLPGAVFFCAHNWSLYGHFFVTGYGQVGWLFERRWIGVTLWHYACWLPALFTPIVCLALGLPWLARTESRKAALLGLWALVFPAFYSAYVFSHESWWYLRFLLPAVPAFVVGGLLVARRIAAGWHLRIPRNQACAFALVLVITHSAFWTKKLDALAVGWDEETYPQAAAWMKANLPDNAVILAMQMSGTITYYTDFAFLRWDLLDSASRDRVSAAMQAAHRPIFAALFPFETDAALRERMPGPWRQVGKVRSLTVWRNDFNGAVSLSTAPPINVSGQTAFIWRLPIEPPAPVMWAYKLLNLLAWIVLGGLLWWLLPMKQGREWFMVGGILFSIGVISSIRFALTDLIALALLAGAMFALDRGWHRWAAVLLGTTSVGQSTALMAFPALGRPPWFSWPNLRSSLLVLALPAVALAWTRWRFGSAEAISSCLGWPGIGFLGQWEDSIAYLSQGQAPWIALTSLFALLGLTAQAAFFFRHWHEHEPWWRLGIAFAVLSIFLDDTIWASPAGGAIRLLPLTLAFNVFVCRIRARWAWLLVGNLTVIAGILSLCYTLPPPADLAAIRSAGVAQLSGSEGWSAIERGPRHTWSWSSGAARLKIEAWPKTPQSLVVDFLLGSLTARTVTICQGEQVLWQGRLGPRLTRVQCNCRLMNGHVLLDFLTDAPAVAETSEPDARRLAFALYDPSLTVAGR